MDITIRNRYLPKVQHISLVSSAKKQRTSLSAIKQKGRNNLNNTYFTQDVQNKFINQFSTSHDNQIQEISQNDENQGSYLHTDQNLTESNNSQFYSVQNISNSKKSEQKSAKKSLNCSQLNFDKFYLQKEPDFDNLQQMVQFQEFPEFDTIQDNEIIIVIQTYFNINNPLVSSNQECAERFGNKVQEIIENISKKFPFIKLVHKKLDTQDIDTLFQDNIPQYGLLEIYLCSFIQNQMNKKIVYSKNKLKYLPNLKYITENIKQSLKFQTCNLTVKLDSLMKDIRILGSSKSVDNSKINDFQGIEVILTQKLTQKIKYQPFNNLFGTQNDSSYYQSQKGLLRSMKSLNISKIKLNNQQESFQQSIAKQNPFYGTVQDSFLESKQGTHFKTQVSQIKKMENQLDILEKGDKGQASVPQVLTKKGISDKNGEIQFKELITLIGDFELIVNINTHRHFKPYSTIINLEKLVEQQNSKNVQINCFLERDDFVQCEINVVDFKNKQFLEDAEIQIANFNFLNYITKKPLCSLEKQREIDTFKNYKGCDFYVVPGFYYISIRKSGYHQEYKEVHIKKGKFSLDVVLQEKNKGFITFQSLNIMNKKPISFVELTILDKATNEILDYGQTNDLGLFTLQVQLMTNLVVQAELDGFMKIKYEFELNSQHVYNKNNLNLFLIPSYHKKEHDFFEILIHQPNPEINIDFKLNDSNNEIIDKHNPQNIFMQIEQPPINIKDKKTRLTSFSIENIHMKDQFIELIGQTIPQKSFLKETQMSQELINGNMNSYNSFNSSNKKVNDNKGKYMAQNAQSAFLKKRMSLGSQQKELQIRQAAQMQQRQNQYQNQPILEKIKHNSMENKEQPLQQSQNQVEETTMQKQSKFFNKIAEQEQKYMIKNIKDLDQIDKNNDKLQFSFYEGVKVSDQDAITYGQVIKEFKNLIDLTVDIDNFKISNSGIITLCQAIKELKNLQKLFICFNNNQLNKETVYSISQAIKEQKGLQNLIILLEHSEICNEGVSSLGQTIENLENLEYLKMYLGSNKITDSGADQLGQSFQKLKNLKELIIDYRQNNISDSGINSLSQAIKDIKNLTKLSIDIRLSEISDTGVNSLCQAVKEQKNLNVFQFYAVDNGLSDSSINSLSQAVKNLNNLTEFGFDLSNNNITDSGIDSLAQALEQQKNLTNLLIDLRQIQISGSCANKLSQAIKQMKNLNLLFFFLCQNKIFDSNVNLLCQSFKELKNLKEFYLNLSECELSDTSANYISEAIKQMKDLTALEVLLNQNSISHHGAKPLGQAIKEQKNIQSSLIDLSQNSIGDSGAIYLAQAIKEQKNLKCFQIRLSQCKLSDSGFKSLVEAIYELKNVDRLKINLGKNYIYDKYTNFITEAFKQLKDVSLLHIDLRNNKMSDTTAISLSQSIKEIRNVKRLNLNLMGNKITDKGFESIYQAVKELQNLNELLISMRYNQISQEGQKKFQKNLEDQFKNKLRKKKIIF